MHTAYSDSDRLLRVDSMRNGQTTYTYDARGNRISAKTGDDLYRYEWDLTNRLEAVNHNGTLLFAALYDGDSNRIFTAQRNPDITTVTNTPSRRYSYDTSFETTSSIPTTSTVATRTAGTNDKIRIVTDTTASYISDFWYGFHQGFTSRMCLNSAQSSRWLYVNWDLIARSENTTERHVTDKGERSKVEKENKRTEKIIDAIGIDEGAGRVFIPATSTSVTVKDYELTFYLNDVNTQHTRTLVECDPDGAVRATYEYADSLLARQTPQGCDTYLYDGRGSVANITDSAGNITASYTYDTFGTPNVAGTTTNPYSYNAERIDRTTRLQYLRARYLDPSVGRFISQDTYLGEVLRPLSQNQYIYAHNDPMNYIDPSGNIRLLTTLSNAWNATTTFISNAWNATTTFISNTWNTLTSWVTPSSNQNTFLTGPHTSGSGGSGNSSSSSSGRGGGNSSPYQTIHMTASQLSQRALEERKRKLCEEFTTRATGGAPLSSTNCHVTPGATVCGVQQVQLTHAQAALIVAGIFGAGIGVAAFAMYGGGALITTATGAVVSVLYRGGQWVVESVTKVGNVARDVLLKGVTNPKLINTINELYRPGGKVGDGGLADALRHELATGQLVGGVSHIQKGFERIANLESIIRTQNLNPHDLAVATKLLNDLKNALGQ